MYWPMLNGKSRLMKTQDVFGGYDHNMRIGEESFFDMENMTSDHYPILSPRAGRVLYETAGAPQGLIEKDALCYVDGSAFVMNKNRIEMGLSEDRKDCPKQLISMGAYVIILPDKKYINTADLSDRGSLEANFTTEAPVRFSMCDMEGRDYTPAYCQPEEPAEPENMAYWVDTASQPPVLKQWSQSSALWIGVEHTCVKIASPGIGKPFERYDGVFLKGLTGTLTEAESGMEIADSSELAALEGTAVILEKEDDHLVISGILSVPRTIRNPLSVSREMPDMDFVIQRGNRLWGCRYGLNTEGRVVNEIYASKLGDFKNWNCFMGLSTDSYVVAVGSDGPFTGAVTHSGYPLFWKENCVHKLYGDIPANFGVQTTLCRGVQRGCHNSLAIVNELLYYKARHGICVYDGSLPMEISQALGEEPYSNAVGGSYGNKYYVCMEDSQGRSHLFVYDTARGLWHREDAFRANALCACENRLYGIEAGTGRIWQLAGPVESGSERVRWMIQTGPLGMDLQEKKYICRLLLRMSMEQGAGIQAYIQYDSLPGWEPVGGVRAQRLSSISMPVRPRRCDHFRLRLEGEGQVRIHSLTRFLTQGSDRI